VNYKHEALWLSKKHKLYTLCTLILPNTFHVATLALGSRLKQGITKVCTKCESWESHFMLPRVWESVREWTSTFSSELPFWEWESRWTFESSKNNCKGPNLLDWRVIYIIGNFLKRRCLKWAHMTHSNTSNTSYGQKRGRKSNWQFDSRPLKVGDRHDFLAWRWRVTYRWKTLNKGYKFSSNLISIKGLHAKL
jgi:hypothetical protein